MANYRLHYAGCTFDLRDKEEGKTLLAKARAVSAGGAGAIVTVNLVKGMLQVLLTTYVALAISEEPDEVPAASVFEKRGPLVI